MASWAEQLVHKHVSSWVSSNGSPRMEKMVLEVIHEAIEEAARRCDFIMLNTGTLTIAQGALDCKTAVLTLLNNVEKKTTKKKRRKK